MAREELRDVHAVSVERFLRVGISDLANRLARHGLEVHRRGARDLTRQHDFAAPHEYLTRNATLGILREMRVEDRVGEIDCRIRFQLVR